MISTNNFTIVYTVNDKEAFKEEFARLNNDFKSSKGEAWAITAMSHGHEIDRLSLIETAHDENRHDLLDEIFGLLDPAKIKSIRELKGY